MNLIASSPFLQIGENAILGILFILFGIALAVSTRWIDDKMAKIALIVVGILWVAGGIFLLYNKLPVLNAPPM